MNSVHSSFVGKTAMCDTMRYGRIPDINVRPTQHLGNLRCRDNTPCTIKIVIHSNALWWRNNFYLNYCAIDVDIDIDMRHVQALSLIHI